jgi:hypothetical protein
MEKLNQLEQDIFLEIKKLIKEHTDPKLLKDIKNKYPTIFDNALLECMQETSNNLKNK